jgi:hypothetical protein
VAHLVKKALDRHVAAGPIVSLVDANAAVCMALERGAGAISSRQLTNWHRRCGDSESSPYLKVAASRAGRISGDGLCRTGAASRRHSPISASKCCRGCGILPEPSSESKTIRAGADSQGRGQSRTCKIGYAERFSSGAESIAPNEQGTTRIQIRPGFGGIFGAPHGQIRIESSTST